MKSLPVAIGLLAVSGMAHAPAMATRNIAPTAAPAIEDGYDLWLRYRPITDAATSTAYRSRLKQLVVLGATPTLDIARDELHRGVSGMLGSAPERIDALKDANSGAVIVATTATLTSAFAEHRTTFPAPLRAELARTGNEGFVVRTLPIPGKGAAQSAIYIVANTDVGTLHGVFHLLRLLQTRESITTLQITSRPRIQRRILNHWDNLDRSVERGYAGKSLWDWQALPGPLPDSLLTRYRDYARANASLGINGTVLTNVNANATVLTSAYLSKVAALARIFRPYGLRTYLTARFSAPIEIGGLRTADPLDPAVRAWWNSKIAEIYDSIPDFGGVVVKANSEGQPGPQDYKRSHADGANMLADALQPHGGVVMWRAFVYSNDVPVDRVRQAWDEFKPLDGTFRSNVMVQVKNGALDFQPREPFHPLFGAMPRTPLVMEFQITKEYLGQDTHLVFMAPYFKEVLDADTWSKGRGTTVARIIDGSVDRHTLSAIAGVANIGNDRDWTGSHFNQANWYAYGRLAWDPSLSSSTIADEWIRQTLTTDARAIPVIRHLMLVSREAVVNYMTPLGLAHIMATNHHYGPGAWANGGRADWTPSYYHRADTTAIGFDRTARGSNAIAQYAPPVAQQFAQRSTVPDNVLLWFHRVGWNERTKSGRTLWNDLALRYQEGVDSVRAMQRAWTSVRSHIDAPRHKQVAEFLAIQEQEARWWRDASLLYFSQFSRQPLPRGVETPAHSFDLYRRLRCPPDRDKPRCPDLTTPPTPSRQ
ncbi:MAG: alpha-glucuronidase [Gemmatimonadaceae bacterium]|nr:alpha-glucuronidase [Gemmatimonadaceae bacterium]